jgi:hypothetical protein
LEAWAAELDAKFHTKLKTAIAPYKGYQKKFLVQIAGALDIPTTEPKYDRKGECCGEKALTTEGLKEAIAQNVGDSTLLIIPNAHRLPASICYWLEDLLDTGVRLVMLAVTSLRRDLFVRMLEIESTLPSDAEIRLIMEREAKRMGLPLTPSELADLQTRAGRNPLSACKSLWANAIGVKNYKSEHSQYLDISPLLMSLGLFGAMVRFVALGTGNRALYVIGGIVFIFFLMLRQLSRIRGSRRK